MAKKKYNDKSITFSDWTTKKLKQEAKAYHQQINQIGCYGSKDTMAYYGILDVLAKRGIEPIEEIRF